MLIGGLQKLSLIDYPNMLSCVIFTQGCNFRCGFCHNPELVDPRLFSKPIPIKGIMSFLRKRRRFLDGVVICGGEPFLQDDLLDFVSRVKGMGYLVKIDTNGGFPERLRDAIPLIDYIAMDIKAPISNYKDITGKDVDEERIRESIRIIKGSGKGYEFRTTLLRSKLKMEDILNIGEEIKGARLYVLQAFIPHKVLDKGLLNERSYSLKELQPIKEILEREFVERCLLRV